MATAIWNGGTGDFNTGSLWSTGAVPGAADIAVVDAGSGASSITLDGAESVAGLTLDDALGTLALSGALSLNSGVLNLQAGSLTVSGTVSDGTLTPDGGVLTLSGPSAALLGVTVEGTLDLANSGAQVDVTGLAQSGLTQIDLGANTQILFLDQEIFQGQTIEMAGGVLATDDNDSNNGSLFFGPDTTVIQNAASTTARIGPDTATSLFGLGQVTNEGVLIAAAGTLDLDSEGGAFDSELDQGPFTNVGTIEIDAGATVIDDTNSTLPGLGTILNSGGLLDLRGTLTNTNTTIDVGATGTFRDLQLDDTVIGGAIALDGGTLVANNAYWQGVTVHGTGFAFSYLRLADNSAFNPGGAPITLTAVAADYAQLDLGNSEVLANAIVNIGTSTPEVIISADYNGTSTLAATTTINVGSGQVLSFQSPGALVNDAVINLAAGGELQFDNIATYASNGTINVAPGANVVFNGTLGLNALGTVVGSGAKLVNLNTLDLDGLTLSTAGDANFSSFVNEGEVTDGTLVTVAGQNPDLGIIDGGTLVTGPGVLPVSSVTLGDATLQGAVQLTTDGVLDVTGNLHLENADGTGPGTLILDQQPKLFVLGSATSVQFLQSMTLSNAVVMLSGVTPATETAAFNSESDLEVQGFFTVTLAPNVEIVDTTVNGPIGILGGPGFFVNQGIIAVTPGADLVLGPYGSATQQDFINQGLITIAPGGTLDVATQASILSLGSIVGPGGLLRLDAPDSGSAVYQNTGNTITVGGPSGAPNFQLDDATITGGTIVNAGGEFTALEGNLTGVTYIGPLDLTSGSNYLGNTSAGFLYFNGGTLDSQSVTLPAGAELILGMSQSFVGATLSLGGELADTGNTLSFDTNTVVDITGSVYMPVGHLLNAGTIDIGPGASLDLNDAGAASGPETSEPGTIVIDDGTFTSTALNAGQTVELGTDSSFTVSRFDPGSDVVFAAPNTLTVNHGATFGAGAVVSDFGVGDTIALTGYDDGIAANPPTEPVTSLAFDSSSNTLDVIQTNVTASVTNIATIAAIPVGPGYVASGFTLMPVGSTLDVSGTIYPLLVTGYDITYAPPDQTPPAAPEISGTRAGQTTTDLAAVDPFSSVSITDVNTGAVDTAIVTLTGTVDIAGTDEIGGSATGTLSNLGIGTLIDGGEGYVVSGSAAAVQAALRGLVFTPVAHQATPGLPVTTSFTIALNDQVGSVTDATTSVVATAVQDPIQLSGVIPLVYTSNNVNAAQPFSNVTISDPDNATFTATATLASTQYASFAASFGATVASNGVWSTTGSLAAVTTALHGLVAYVTEPPLPTGQSVSTTITMAISNGLTQSVTAVSTIDIVSSSTADSAGLQIIGATPGQMTSDQSPIAAFANVAVTDSQVGALDTVTVTMSNPADGTFSDPLGGTINAGTFTVSATPTASDFGFVSGIYDVLDGLIFTPTRGQVPLGQSVTTDFTIVASNDLGSVTDASTSVIATDEGGQLAINGAQANQEFSDDTNVLPLAGVTITDTQPTPVDTATVTLSNPASGVLTAGNGGTVGVDGVFRITGPLDEVQAALQAVGFTPAGLVTSQTATSGLTISVTDGTLNATNTTTSLEVIGTEAPQGAGTVPAMLSGTLANIGVVDETPLTPFSGLTVTDAGAGDTDTVTITLANPAFGTPSNLDGGSYNSTSGVYSITSTPSAVTTAIDGLQVTPAAPAANVYLTSTTLTFTLAGPGGGPAAQNAIAASVQQVLGLTSIPLSNIAISVSPDGSDFASPNPSKTNEAAITTPTTNTTYTLPAGYQAEYLGGNTNATLQDTAVGNAVLVGNTGNDLLIGGAANDSIVAGNGNNTLEGGSGTVALLTGNGNDSITTSTNSTYTVTLGGGADTVFAASAGAGTVTGGSGADLIDATGTGATASDTILSQGLEGSVLGGAGTLTVRDVGAHDWVQAGSGATTVTLNGSLTRIRGGTGNFTVLDQTASNTVIGGTAGLASVTIAAAAAATDEFGRPGDQAILDLGANALIGSGEGNAVVSMDGANSQLYGGGGNLDVSIGAAGVLVAGLAANTTVDASSSLASGALVFGGFENTPSQDGALSVRGGADQLLAITGGSNSTIDAATSDTVFTGIYIGTGSIAGNVLINGSASALQVNFIGGASATTVLGSSGQVTLFGGNGTDADFIGSSVSGAPGGILFANGASVGGETLNAGSSTTNDTLFGLQGNDSLVASSGADLLVGGENTGSLGGAGTVTGGDTMVGGTGADLMIFSAGAFAGGAVVINFSAADTVFLSGYNSVAGGNQASMALANATTAGSDTTIALADGTHITFVDTTTALLQAHLASS